MLAYSIGAKEKATILRAIRETKTIQTTFIDLLEFILIHQYDIK